MGMLPPTNHAFELEIVPDRLKYKSGAAGCTYIESVVARCDGAGMKRKFS